MQPASPQKVFPVIRWPPIVRATKLREMICNPVSSVPCTLCALRSISRFPVSVSRSLESVSGILELLLLRPCQDGRRIRGEPRITTKKSLNFQADSRATKTMRNGPNAERNTKNIDPEIMRIPTSAKVVHCKSPHAKCCGFPIRDIDIHTTSTTK